MPVRKGKFYLSKRFINGYDFANMVYAGASVLKSHVETINGLNVFPVPDGDTGTNMNMTMTSGIEQLRNKATEHLGHNAEILSKGLLMGARGNSGVILSQLFRGFAKAVHDQEQIGAAQFAAALQQGVDTAYQAIMKPVEGTILTVSREAAKHGASVSRKVRDLHDLMREVYFKASETLARTPDLLPVLKQVGVVDSGGQGLVYIYEGFVRFLSGSDTTDTIEETDASKVSIAQASAEIAQAKLATDDIVFPYDMEFFIHLNRASGVTFIEEEFSRKLAENGDSILLITDDDDVKVHVHTRAPGDVINLAMRYGELSRFHIENMRETHRDLIDHATANETGESNHAANVSELSETETQAADEQEMKPFGMVAVAAGDGITEIFESVGVDCVLSGGQTMNPSTEDIVKAIESVPAETVFVFPNNSNIILAAEQAKEVSDREVVVIPTKSIPQGITAVLAYQETTTAAENEQTMKHAIETVKSGSITVSIRDTMMDGVAIRKDDFIGIVDGKIVGSSDHLLSVGTKLLQHMIETGKEIVTIFTGAAADAGDTEQMLAYVREHYPEVEVEVHEGGQPVYHYIFSAE